MDNQFDKKIKIAVISVISVAIILIIAIIDNSEFSKQQSFEVNFNGAFELAVEGDYDKAKSKFSWLQKIASNENHRLASYGYDFCIALENYYNEDYRNAYRNITNANKFTYLLNTSNQEYANKMINLIESKYMDYKSQYDKEDQQIKTQTSNSNSNHNTTSYSKVDSSENETCKHHGCNRKKTSNSDYCSYHTCSVKGCYKEVSSANAKCEKHHKEYMDEIGLGDKPDVENCAVTGCNTDAYGSSKYCISHKCRQSGCNNGTCKGSGYCYDHSPH